MSLNFPAKPFSSSQHRTTAPPYVLHDVIYFVGCEIAPRQRNFGRVWLFGQLGLVLDSPIPATLSMGLARAKVPTRRRSSLCSSLHHYHQFKSRKSANVVVSRKIFRQLSVSLKYFLPCFYFSKKSDSEKCCEIYQLRMDTPVSFTKGGQIPKTFFKKFEIVFRRSRKNSFIQFLLVDLNFSNNNKIF